MKRYFSLFIACLLAVTAPTMSAASTTNASKFVDKVASDVLAIVQRDTLDEAEKKEATKEIFRDIVDIPFVAKFVLGKHWRTANAADRVRYTEAYEPFLINNYVGRIAKYSGQSYKLVKSRKDSKDYVVSMELLDPNGPNVLMDYRVRGSGSNFKIIDIVVEGVSLLTTQRSEFGSVVDKRGLDFLINALKKKAEQNA